MQSWQSVSAWPDPRETRSQIDELALALGKGIEGAVEELKTEGLL